MKHGKDAKTDLGQTANHSWSVPEYPAIFKHTQVLDQVDNTNFLHLMHKNKNQLLSPNFAYGTVVRRDSAPSNCTYLCSAGGDSEHLVNIQRPCK